MCENHTSMLKVPDSLIAGMGPTLGEKASAGAWSPYRDGMSHGSEDKHQLDAFDGSDPRKHALC